MWLFVVNTCAINFLSVISMIDKWISIYIGFLFIQIFDFLIDWPSFRRNQLTTLVILIFIRAPVARNRLFFSPPPSIKNFFSVIFKVNFIYLGFVYKSIITLHLFFDESKLAALVTPSDFNFHLNSRREVLTFRIIFLVFYLKCNLIFK